jgi:dienelactone hydrolase
VSGSDPDVVVGISSCYYENEGKPIHWFDDGSSWGNKGADIYLLPGDQDTRCPAWQSQRLASALPDAGYHVDLVQLTGADHSHRSSTRCTTDSSRWSRTTPPVKRAVQVVLDAIATRQHTASEQ